MANEVTEVVYAFGQWPAQPSEPRVNVLVYDLETGRIDHLNQNIPVSMAAAQAGPGQGVVPSELGADAGLEWFVLDGVTTRRAQAAFDRTRIPADGETVATLRMDGAFIVRVDGEAFEASDVFELAADMPGTYRVQVDDPPAAWLPIDVEITAE